MTEALAPSPLLLLSSAAIRAVVDDGARVQRMLDFVAALARAEAAVGVIPHDAVDPITAATKAERYDLAALAAAAPAVGIIFAPLAGEVAKTSAHAAAFVHWGATAQDAIDTALVLELRAGLDALIADLAERVTLLVTPGEIANLFEPLSYQGVAQTFIKRLVASTQSRVPRR